MRVEAINGSSQLVADPIVAISRTLTALAARQSVSVDELVSNARAASDPTPAQQRVIRLQERLDSLS